MPRSRAFTKSQRDRYLEELRRGHSRAQAARAVSWAPSTVARWHGWGRENKDPIWATFLADTLAAEREFKTAAKAIPARNGKGVTIRLRWPGSGPIEELDADTRVDRVELPPLHPGQQRIADALLSGVRFLVVVCGRQWGKTSLGAALAVAQAARGRVILWAVPSFRLGRWGWAPLKWFARQIPGAQIRERPLYEITFPSGGMVLVGSSDDPHSLRGATLDGVVFDEAAVADSAEGWTVLRPTLGIRNGWALFISTPRGMGHWYHDLYEQAGTRSDWTRFQCPSSDNPHLTAEEIQAAREELPAGVFDQEYQAKFISPAQQRFKPAWIRHWTPEYGAEGRVFKLGEHRVPESSCWKLITTDFAWTVSEGADYSVFLVFCVTPLNHLILIDAFRGRLESPDVLKELKRQNERHQPRYICCERSTRQLTILQQAKYEGLPIKEVVADKSKESRSVPAQVALEQGRVWFPTEQLLPIWPDLEREIVSFPGRHDDVVDALSYACIEVPPQGRRGGMQIIDFGPEAPWY